MGAVDPSVYKSVLKVRRAYGFDIACFLMRFYQYMMNVGTVTMITLSGHSFLLAGAVSSAIAISTFIVAPQVSRLVDRYGQSRVVPFATAITVLGFALLVGNMALGGPEWLCFPAAVLMGFVPSAPALARARWTHLIRSGELGKDAPDLRTMFSYEGVLDDIGFMFGPSISIALASSIAPVAGMLAGAIALVVGTVVLTLSRSTEPKPSMGKGAAGQGSADEPAKVAGVPAKERSLLATTPVVRVLFVTMMFLGAMFGVYDSTTVGLAEELGDANIASVALMISAFVSMGAGFVFGMLRFRAPQYQQITVAALLLGVSFGAMFLIESMPVLLVVTVVGSLFYAPFLIVANATVERAVSTERLTEGITWVNAGITCGMAVGPSAAGFMIDGFGAPASFDLGALFAIAIPVLILLFRRVLKSQLRQECYQEMGKAPAREK